MNNEEIGKNYYYGIPIGIRMGSASSYITRNQYTYVIRV